MFFRFFFVVFSLFFAFFISRSMSFFPFLPLHRLYFSHPLFTAYDEYKTEYVSSDAASVLEKSPIFRGHRCVHRHVGLQRQAPRATMRGAESGPLASHMVTVGATPFLPSPPP